MAEVSSKPQQYLVSQSPGIQAQNMLIQPLSFAQIQAILDADPGVDVHETIERQDLDLFSTGPVASDGVIVASMSEQTAQILAQSSQVFIEPDYPVSLAEPTPTLPLFGLNPSDFTPFGTSVTYVLAVLDENGNGIKEAAVHVYGDLPVAGTTGADGRVTITLQNQSSPDPRALYVVPKSGYWNLWVDNPQLTTGGVNSITLSSLTSTFPSLVSQETYGWGQLAMGLDKLPPEYRGAGVKVAIIDSGAASVTHPDLGNIKAGSDLTVNPPANTWTTDTIAHGSHCAGVITGSTGANGIRGFAPDAEIHVLKVFPGGHFSTLLAALNYCIANRVDVVNMSLGSEAQSQLLLEKLSQARQNGIACIVAAGNSAGKVQFPGSSSDVLTVAAMGKTGTFPDTSFHSRQMGPAAQGTGAASGYFSAKFTCFGPKVDVCAPGVAVLSSVPDDGFAVWDGTSMAAPHVTGMAALLLAHHPDFKDAFQPRNSARVDRLFQIIKQSATPLNVGDRDRTGVGIPNVERALTMSLPATPTNSSDALAVLVRSVLRALQRMNAAPNRAQPLQTPSSPLDETQAVLALLERIAR